MFSKSCEYGIKALLHIAARSLGNERVKIGEVAKHSGVPEAFTGKILGILIKNGIINSYTGPNGGYEISVQKMKSTTISDVVSVIDGDSVFYGCALGLSHCDENHPCPMHGTFAGIRDRLRVALQSKTVYDLAVGLENGDSILIR